MSSSLYVGRGARAFACASLAALLCADSTAVLLARWVEPLRIVVHVQDYVHVPPRELAAIEAESARLFRDIGVATEWRHRWTPLEDSLTAPDLNVAILTPDMVEQKCRTDGLSENVVGTGLRSTGHAYIFYHRVIALTDRNGLNRSELLSRVLTHELGHMISGLAHNSIGIMRAQLAPEAAGFHRFTAAEGVAIRNALSAAFAADAPRFALRTSK